ncbi:HET-domain-containing protein, partial [Colletotrichum eremochloae]
MPVFNAYHYEPLCTEDAVRLVVLIPAAKEAAPLRCSIIQRQRSTQSEAYSALSYTWGTYEFTRTLEIESDGDTSYMRITLNLDTALRQFRASVKEICLWIDAICLNQNDEVEKAQQIPLMGHIYGEAKMVHIWLGPADHMTPSLFTFFRVISRLAESEQNTMAERVASLLRKLCGHDNVAGLGALHKFFLRPWFSRRWVIQEACLAREAVVHCGGHSILLHSVALAAKRFQSLDLASYPINMAANLLNPTTKRSMLELLWYFHDAECLEPRDRIAALSGLTLDKYSALLDYTVHWTQLYKQFASLVFDLGTEDAKLQLLLQLFEFG